MELDRNGLEILTRAECLALLTTVPLGRVGLSLNALPTVLPVNFIVSLDHNVVFRTGHGTKLRAALNGAVVAFEADSYDQATRSGWSVLVQDVARLLAEPEEDALWEPPLRTWANHNATQLVSIGTTRVSGRRFLPRSGNT